MSKKSRRKQLAEKVLRSKRRDKQVEKKPNPFEMKFNKQKHQVAGQRRKPTAAGLPLLSRQRAFDQRKKTLLMDYRRFGKANEIVDRRLGERNPNLTPDQKMALRFAAERSRRYKTGGNVETLPASSNFQLTGAESILTHRGTAISEIEKLNDRPVFDDEDEEGGQVLGSDFVKLAHFGGGHGAGLPGSEKDDQQQEGIGERKKSRKELIEEMIENSKRARFEMQMQREKASDLTADLDAQWKDALKQNLVTQWVRNKDEEAANEPKTSGSAKQTNNSSVLDYDRLVHEMTFEPKAAAATDKSIKEGKDGVLPENGEGDTTVLSSKNRQLKSKFRMHVTGDDDVGDLQRFKANKEKPFMVSYDSKGQLIQDESLADPQEESPLSGKKKQCGIEFLEPRIEANFNPERKKRRTVKAETAERQVLVQKVRKEFRGAIRELKRDNEFLAREQLREERRQDAERRHKVKELMKSLVSQETECKRLKRMKQRM